MPQPPAYNRQKNFTDDFGHETDHSALNAELDKASNSINDIRHNLAILQADDGRLRPDVVTYDSLDEKIVLDISAAVRSDVQGELDRAETAAVKAESEADRAEAAAAASDASAIQSDASAVQSGASAKDSATSARTARETIENIEDYVDLVQGYTQTIEIQGLVASLYDMGQLSSGVIDSILDFGDISSMPDPTGNYGVRLKLLRGTTEENLAYIGEEGEITVDTGLKNARVHDGVTPGGHLLEADFSAVLSQANSYTNSVAAGIRSDMADLETIVDGNTSGITRNTDSIAAMQSAVNANTTSLADLEIAVDGHTNEMTAKWVILNNHDNAIRDLGTVTSANAVGITGLQTAAETSATDITDLHTSVSDHETRITTLEEAPPGTGGEVDLSGINATLAGHEAQLEDHETRIAVLEETGVGTGGDVDLSGVNATLASHETRITTLEEESGAGLQYFVSQNNGTGVVSSTMSPGTNVGAWDGFNTIPGAGSYTYSINLPAGTYIVRALMGFYASSSSGVYLGINLYLRLGTSIDYIQGKSVYIPATGETTAVSHSASCSLATVITLTAKTTIIFSATRSSTSWTVTYSGGDVLILKIA